ncbi:MAG: hypothetical protein H6730_27695 [Deltaproteobacteria bacterium]|nr:hypothetical protein [Deltaproteobacteria bacterium]
MTRDKPNDQRYLQTMQVRVRRQNPLIERKASIPEQTVLEEPGAPEPAPVYVPPTAPMQASESSEVGSSIYDRMEHGEDDLAAAAAELESALEGLPRDGGELPRVSPEARLMPAAAPAPVPRAPEAEEETRTYVRPTPAPPVMPPAEAPRPARAPAPDRADTVLEAPADPLVTRPRPKEKRRDPTTGGRARARRDAPPPPRPGPAPRLETDPTPVETGPTPAVAPPASAPAPAPRAAAFLDDDETVLAAEPPRVGHTWTEQNQPGFRLVRRREGPAPRPAPPPIPEAPTVVPRHRLAQLGTDAAGEALKEHALQAMGQRLEHIRTPALRLVRGELEPAAMAICDEVCSGGYDSPHQEAGTSPKRALERLLNEKHYSSLAPKEQALLLTAVAASPRDATTTKAALALLKSGAVRRLSPGERPALFRCFEAVGPEGRVRLAQVAARRLRGRSALEDRDLQDQALVTHLEHLVMGRGWVQGLEVRGLTRDKAVAVVLGALAHPERLSFEEGSPGVLGIMEFALADCAPAELVRLWRHLVSDELVAPMAGPAALDLGACLRADPELTLNSSSSPLRLALTGLAELAQPAGRGRRPTFIMPGGHGVDADVVSRALGLLFGVNFTVAAGAANALRHLARVPAEPQRMPPVFVTVLYARGERLFVFDHMDADWVYLRAPRGRSSKERGALRVDPKREVVEPERGLDRIPREAFEDKVGVGLIPRL